MKNDYHKITIIFWFLSSILGFIYGISELIKVINSDLLLLITIKESLFSIFVIVISLLLLFAAICALISIKMKGK